MTSRRKFTAARTVAVVLLLAAASTAAAANGKVLPNGDLQIQKKEVNAAAKFYPVKVDGVLIEILALRAPDGTVRTALNTCQVCYSSGRGYYVQEGDVLVCQNCGNRFKASQVELIKGGCNPVPITSEIKTETADTITISRAILEQAKPFFLNWRKR